MKQIVRSRKVLSLGAAILLILLAVVLGTSLVKNAEAQGLCEYNIYTLFFCRPLVQVGLPVCLDVAINPAGRPRDPDSFGRMRAAIEVDESGILEVGSCGEGEFPIMLEWICIGQDAGGGFSREELECKPPPSP